MTEEVDLAQFPIITYTNRIQRQMDRITFVMSQYSDHHVHIVAALRMLLANYPPAGKKKLEEDYTKLRTYDRDISTIKNFSDLVDIYDRASNWAYENLFQDAFKFRPKNPKEAHIGGGEE